MPQFEQFDTFIGQAFWLAIFYGILLFALRTSIIPRLRNVLDRRRLRIDHLLTEASQAQAETDKLRHDLDGAVGKTREKASAILEETRIHIRSKEEEFLQRLSSKLDKQLSDAEKEMIAYRQKLSNTLPDLLKQHAQEILDRVCQGRSTSPSLNTELNRVIARLSSAENDVVKILDDNN